MNRTFNVEIQQKRNSVTTLKNTKPTIYVKINESTGNLSRKIPTKVTEKRLKVEILFFFVQKHETFCWIGHCKSSLIFSFLICKTTQNKLKNRWNQSLTQKILKENEKETT